MVQAADIFPGADSSDPGGFTAFNGELYFNADGGSDGFELWKVKADGSVVQAADINPGADNSDPFFFTAFNGELYFNADDGSDGVELWKVKADGSVVQAADINPGADSSFAQRFTAFNGELYFLADDGLSGFEPWKVRADGSVVQAANINPGGSSLLPFGFTVFTVFNLAPAISPATLAAVAEDTANPPGATVASLVIRRSALPTDGGAHRRHRGGGKPRRHARRLAILDRRRNQLVCDRRGERHFGARAERGGAAALPAGGRLQRRAAGALGLWPRRPIRRRLHNGGTRSAIDASVNGGSTAISDNTATLGSSISEVNDAPAAVDDALSSIARTAARAPSRSPSLIGNDSRGPANEAGQALTVRRWANAVGGTVQIVGGNVVFTPDADFNGAASFDYTVQDNGTSNGAADPLTAIGKGHVHDHGRRTETTIARPVDFNADGIDDLLWRNADGSICVLDLGRRQVATIGSVAPSTQTEGTGDFNGDGRGDILFQTADRHVVTWLMNGSQIAAITDLGSAAPGWHIAGTGDFNGNGADDILWRNDNGQVATWQIDQRAAVVGSGRGLGGPVVAHRAAPRISTATAGTTSCGATTTARSRPG